MLENEREKGQSNARKESTSETDIQAGGVLLGAATTTFVTMNANAQLIGNDVTAEWRYPDFNAVLESHVVNVSNAVELTANDIQNDFKFDIDIGDD